MCNPECFLDNFLIFSLAGGGIASDEENLGLPLHVNDFDSIKVHLNVFVNMYGLSVVCIETKPIFPERIHNVYIRHSLERTKKIRTIRIEKVCIKTNYLNKNEE
jgi:hypothetical protein